MCLRELSCLDLVVNANKSACIRVGGGFKTDCSEIGIDGVRVPWSGSLKYLGLIFKSSAKLVVDLKPCRSKF